MSFPTVPIRDLRTVVLILAAAVLDGCGSRQAARIDFGVYRATLTLPGGELPFGLELKDEAGKPVVYLLNGAERARVPDAKLKPQRLDLEFPGFGNRLNATVDKQGAIAGQVTLVKRGGREVNLPLKLERGATYRFFKDAPAAASTQSLLKVAGRWAVTFMDAQGQATPAVAELKQAGATVTGSVLTPTGDHRYLAGEVHDDELFLSAFDGASAYLYRAQLTPQRTLSGRFWSGANAAESLTARRDDAAQLPSSTASVVRDSTWSFGFTFPDIEGKAVSLADKQFRGKVVLVVLAGSWCPNCHDEAAFLTPFYARYRGRGLEIISLMFEHFDDPQKSRAAVERFRHKFDIRYTTLIAGLSDKEEATQKLPVLNGVRAFPTTVFLDKKGRVRQLHSGFYGPATGAHYEKLERDFAATVESLLAES